MLKNNGFHNRHSPFSRPFSPASFFANGEQGWWYDPSNFATLFQDSAGTTPVTAVEQPVGLQLDLSKGLVLGSDLNTVPDNWTVGAGWTNSGGGYYSGTNNNGFYKTVFGTSGSTYYEISLTVSDYVSGTVLVSLRGNAATVGTGNGTKTIRLFAGATGDSNFYIYGSGTLNCTISGVSIKAVTGNHRFQSTSANRPVVSARVNLFVGTATLATQSVTTRATTHTLTFTGAGSITLLGTAIGVYTAGTYSVTTTAGTLTATVLGTVTQADLRETNVGVGLPAYQAVVTSTNYDSTGFPIYIKPNGSNQFMQTNSINFTATDKMTVWQGVRKLATSSAALAELSTSVANAGTFAVQAPAAAGADTYLVASNGSLLQAATASGYSPPITNVLTGLCDISGDQITLRINGTQVAQNTGNQGTGNYGNYPAYFYARAGTSVFFNGNDYGSIARGAASTAAQITDGETYINNLTKAY